MNMKGTLDRTKVVLRNLPPEISQATLLDLIDGSFAGRYNWVSFIPTKNSHKYSSYSRAYINFDRPEDVIEFAEFLNGHIFVNEKGTQFKATIEYSPSQRVPKQCFKNDGCEGIIYKDSNYLEFLDHLAKPVENLPSAEIQLERREAELSGSARDIPIVTPLMDFVRQKRAATKGGYRRTSSVGKLNRRASLSSIGSPGSASSRRGSEKKRASPKMHVIRDGSKTDKVANKSTYILICKGYDRAISNDSKDVSSAAGSEILGEETGSAGNDAGKKKVLLLIGKEREILNTSAKIINQKQNQWLDSSGKGIRSINVGKYTHQSPYIFSDQKMQSSNQAEKEKQFSQSSHMQFILKGANGPPEDKATVNSRRKRQENCIRQRPDRGVWTQRSNEVPAGSHNHLGHRGPAHGTKSYDAYSTPNRKHLRSGGASGHGSHEKQVWVQKSSSDS